MPVAKCVKSNNRIHAAIVSVVYDSKTTKLLRVDTESLFKNIPLEENWFNECPTELTSTFYRSCFDYFFVLFYQLNLPTYETAHLLTYFFIIIT